jgi:beta-galactosidase
MKLSHTKYFFEPQRTLRFSQRAQTFMNLVCIFSVSLWFNTLHAQRQDILLNDNWQTIANDTNKNAYNGFEQINYTTKNWKQVNVPHNWDAYEGYRRMLHGNKHGYAWYKKIFTVNKQQSKRYFLFFEGVGSYATVWLNGKQVGTHAGGRTTFTIDVTNDVISGKKNDLAVRADHPANIKNLPWVCGGCSDEKGFSEGSQPMGIFRPVHLIVTDEVRIEPFGVHVWNDIQGKQASLFINTTLKNYSGSTKTVKLFHQLTNKAGLLLASCSTQQQLLTGKEILVEQSMKNLLPALWSLESPYLYNVTTTIIENGRVVDKLVTDFGFRTIKWDRGNSNRFFLNGKPVFINGIAEYEHMLGSSHAFSPEQIKARVSQIQAAGFNAFRDAHHPHNLLYQQLLDENGLLWWTQMSAHVWYNTPEFRNNFKTLLKEWVLERRNSPSLILWGLQNESKLPADFAKECSDIIRQLDPTASSQRLIATCNGGEGTDWDVPQNWTGTYGGNPDTYAQDLKKQVLVGEYGAWRTIDLHAEGGFQQNGAYSEDRFCNLMAKKIQLAESVKDSVAGHFHWLFSSHDNPGRMQGGEGYRALDRIGPLNYKGLFTAWDEPTDAYYMYRSMYADKHKEQMVYIPMHNWTNRWLKPGIKNGIVVYSNCDEVELYDNDYMHLLAKQKRDSSRKCFVFDSVNILSNILHAVGYIDGRPFSEDSIRFFNFPSICKKDSTYWRNNTKPLKNLQYLYRVNCGGDDYTDVNGNKWLADNNNKRSSFYSTSWTNRLNLSLTAFASQRTTQNIIDGTADEKLFQSFRYGRQELKYHFKLPNGEYLVELYFVEPWFGLGHINATGWRVFDVAVNGKVVIKDLDIFKEVGVNMALKKKVIVQIHKGELMIDFPEIKASQAIIAAIAIATVNKNLKVSVQQLQNVVLNSQNAALHRWLNITDTANSITKQTFFQLPPIAYGADYVRWKTKDYKAAFHFNNATDVFIGDTNSVLIPSYLKTFEKQKETVLLNDSTAIFIYKKSFKANEDFAVNNEVGLTITFFQETSNIEPAYDLKPVTVYKAINATWSGKFVKKRMVDDKEKIIFEKPSADNQLEFTINTGVADIYSLTLSYNNPLERNVKGALLLLQTDGTILKKEAIDLTPTKKGKNNYIVTNTGSMINAGTYHVIVTVQDGENISFNSLEVQ